METSPPDAPAVPTGSVPSKKKRGRETAADMVRSLGLVLVAVVVVWYLGQPPASDSQEIRVVDPSGDLSAFRADVPGAPVPRGLSPQWRPTSSTFGRDPGSLRVGYVTPSEQYAEFAVGTGPREEYVPTMTGKETTRMASVDVDGASWEQYRDEDGSLSLVRSYGDVTVVVGTLRSTASLGELRTLAESLTTS